MKHSNFGVTSWESIIYYWGGASFVSSKALEYFILLFLVLERNIDLTAAEKAASPKYVSFR